MSGGIGMINSNTLFEIKAAAFFADTGLMAPGKDAPPDYGGTMEERRSAWDIWLAAYGKQVSQAIRAAADYMEYSDE
jgi:hypothetical protein